MRAREQSADDRAADIVLRALEDEGVRARLREKVTVDVKLSPDGKVSGVTVKGAHDKAGESCIAAAVKRARFGEATRPQTATHRFAI